MKGFEERGDKNSLGFLGSDEGFRMKVFEERVDKNSLRVFWGQTGFLKNRGQMKV